MVLVLELHYCEYSGRICRFRLKWVLRDILAGAGEIEGRVCYKKQSSNTQEKNNGSKERSLVQRSNKNGGTTVY